MKREGPKISAGFFRSGSLWARFRYLILVLIAGMWFIPTLGVFVTSLRTRAASSQSSWWSAFRTGGWTLENYARVLGAQEGLPPPGFGRAFFNTLLISIPSTAIPIIIAAFAAYGIVWIGFRGRSVVYLGVIALLVVPLQVTWIPVLQIYNWLNANLSVSLTGEYYGLIIAHTAYGLPFAMFLLVGAFVQIPRDFIEAAWMDNASNLQVFSRIVIPLTVPVIVSLGIFQFVWVWNDLMNALIFLQDVNKFPLTVSIRNLLGQYGNEWHLLSAGTFISMLVPLAIFFSLQRYFVRGLMAGAIKE